MTTVAFALLLSVTSAKAQWTSVGSSTGISTGLSNWQHLIIGPNDTPYVSFNDEGLSAGQGTIMKYDGTNWVTIGSAGFTAGIAHHSSFALGSNGVVYFSYADGNNMSKGAVMKYDGSSWAALGGTISTGELQYSNMVVVNDTPYVSFLDNGLGGVMTVLKYDGSAWVAVGPNAHITSTQVMYPVMALDANQKIYIAYQDVANGGKLTVMKYDGSNWVVVGNPFLSQPNGGAYDICLTFDHNNTPYVAYWNPFPMGPEASVQKFDGTNWVNVGAPSFTTTIVEFTTLAFDNNNTPYLAFQDGSANGQKASVMKFDGANWLYLGSAGFSNGVSAYTSIAMDGNGNPYVAYFDDGNGGKTTVMKYTLCQAPDNATLGFSDTTICAGDTVTMSLSGNLNDATNWYWYSGSCGGTLVDSGTSIQVAPGDTTTYYVHGLGGCVVEATCTPATVNINNVPVPTVTANGNVLSSSAGSGNQWLLGGTAISGATGSTYTATVTGWYSVMVTSGNCSNVSDSVHVTVGGVQQVNIADNIKVYPTVFDNSVTVAINNAAINNINQWQMLVTDNAGRVVYKEAALKATNTIDLKDLSAGMYFVVINTPYGKQVYKIAKKG